MKPSRRRLLFVALGVVAIALAAAIASASYQQLHGSPLPVTAIYVQPLVVTADSVHLKGGTSDSAPLYHGYDASVSKGVMTVRLRYSIFGRGVGAFDERIPTQGQRVTKVFLADGHATRQVFP